MAVITSEIVKYDGNSTRKFVIDVAIVMGSTSAFSGHVSMVSDITQNETIRLNAIS